MLNTTQNGSPLHAVVEEAVARLYVVIGMIDTYADNLPPVPDDQMHGYEFCIVTDILKDIAKALEGDESTSAAAKGGA